MRPSRVVLLLFAILVIAAGLYVAAAVHRGFGTEAAPSAVEVWVARIMRRASIPAVARDQNNPWRNDPRALEAGRSEFLGQCAACHGVDGTGRTQLGANLYPRVPDLRSAASQALTDGEIHYIIEHGVRLTGMPGWAAAHRQSGDAGWRLVLLIRSLGLREPAHSALVSAPPIAGHFIGSAACQDCHRDIYNRWKRTPMANVVRDPKEHPEAIIPDLATNPLAKFRKEDVALVYGSIWKQRYFTRIGSDYYVEPAQWDIRNRVWRPYLAAKGTDWWVPFYPPDNMKRPTSELCDGCHSVGFDIRTKQVAEWNVGCEQCHGPGSEHAAHPTRENILNPSHFDDVAASDTCIQCHSQGRPVVDPIEGHHYDWAVGYRVGRRLEDYWKLEEHALGTTTFTHFADGTAHKNRMQGNDFIQSVMYRHGITCATCHDVHGTENAAQLRKPANQLCLDCHGPKSANGPRAATLAEHTHHAAGSPGSQCVACHMPQIETTLADVRVSSHTFRFIPPEMTDKYKIPNSCNSCHTDKSTGWAEDAIKRWPGHLSWRSL